MSLVAGDLIDAARQRTYGAQGRQKISTGQLLAELSFQDQLIAQEISQINPGLLVHVDGLSPCNLVENQYGYLLSAGIHYRDFTHVDTVNGVYTPIQLYGGNYRDLPTPVPSGFVTLMGSAGTFFPFDPDNNRWQTSNARAWFSEDAGHEIHYSYVPAPAVLTSLADELLSPDIAREALVCALELRIVLSNPEAPPVRIQDANLRYTGARMSLTFQIHKFVHPGGQRPHGHGGGSDTQWVRRQIG